MQGLVASISGPSGVAVLVPEGGYIHGSLVVNDDGTVSFVSAEEQAKLAAPAGSRAEGEEVGTPGVDPTG